MNHKIDRDTYIIPPNFIESGTFFGGMFKARNVIEAGILAFAIGVPVFSLLPLGLTARIIALCLTALPAALVALIGISGESLSSFLLIFIKYLRNRRIVGGNSAEDAVPAAEHGGKHIKKKAHKPDKAPRRSRRSGREDFPAEFDEVRSYEIRQKLRPVKKQKPAKEKKAAKQKKKVSKERKVKRPIRTQEPKPACLNPVADYLPISKIENGIIYTKDHRYVKVVEVVPINFMLRSAQEQRNIIYSFVSYLKISPIKLQIKVLTRRAEINRHLDTVRKEMEQETNEQCLLMQEDYLQFVQQIGSREAITRRFFLIFEYEPWSNTKRSDEEGEAINALQSAVHTATNYLRQCGNEVIVPENWDEFTVDVLYNLLCRNESAVKPLSVRAQEVVAEYLAKGRDSEIDHITPLEVIPMKTRAEIYGNEAAALLRIVTMYPGLNMQQLLCFHPGKEEIIKTLLSHLQKQGRIFQTDTGGYFPSGWAAKSDSSLIRAAWVLLDFIGQVEYHAPGDFPVKLIFFANGELYEIVYAASGQEALINHALRDDRSGGRRIILVDNPEDIRRIDCPGISGFCTVDAAGQVHYFKKTGGT